MGGFPILSAVTFLPLVGALIIMFVRFATSGASGRDDGATGTELWSFDRSGNVSQISDIRSGPDGSFPIDLVNANGTVHFLAADSTDGTSRLWSSQATVGDAAPFVDAEEPGIAGQTIFLDLNDDGVLNGGEPRVLTQSDDPSTASINEAGRFEFPFSPAGRYTVRQASQSETQSAPVAPQFENVFDASALLPENGGNGSAGVVIQSQNSGRQIRHAAAAGDVNGDGFGDLIINESTNTTLDTRSYVLFGSGDGITTDVAYEALANEDGSRGFVIRPEFATKEHLSTFSAVGDFNGDGFDDLVSQEALIYGSNDPTPIIDLPDLLVENGGDGTTGTRFHFPNSQSANYVNLSQIGDINGDGLNELAISVVQVDTDQALNGGRVYVIYGSADTLPPEMDLDDLANGDGLTGFVIDGDMPNLAIGHTVSSAGDVNRDGLSDILIGTTRREAYVLYGQQDRFESTFQLSSLRETNGGDGRSGFVINVPPGAHTNSQFPTVTGALGRLGDVNGDGADDLLSGYADTARVLFGPISPGLVEANALDLLTADHSAGITLQQFGTVAPVGDFNADGVDDLVFGQVGEIPLAGSLRENVANAYIMFGRPIGKFR